MAKREITIHFSLPIILFLVQVFFFGLLLYLFWNDVVVRLCHDFNMISYKQTCLAVAISLVFFDVCRGIYAKD